MRAKHSYAERGSVSRRSGWAMNQGANEIEAELRSEGFGMQE
jgi:hypothetical protein